MSCAQRIRQAPKVQDELMPGNLTTQENCFKFAKGLIGASVSSFCYLRHIFPSDDFAERKWEGEDIKILKGQSPDAMNFIKNLKGVFDALEKTYLREIRFGIYNDPNKPDDVLETYVFAIQYGTDGAPSVTLNGANEKEVTEKVFKNVKRFLRKMFFMVNNLDSLPTDKKLHVGIKLLYYDERTPADYEPPGYQSTMNSDFCFPNQANPGGVCFGKIETKHHTIKANCKSMFLDKNEVEAEEEENAVVQTEAFESTTGSLATDDRFGNENVIERKSADTSISSSTAQKEYVDDLTVFKMPVLTSNNCSNLRKSSAPQNAVSMLPSAPQPPRTPKTSTVMPLANQSNLTSVSQPSPANSTREENLQMDAKCVCGLQHWDRLMFRCSLCKNVQHAVCYGYLTAPTTNMNDYICAICARNSNNRGTCFDSKLVEPGSDASTMKPLSICRRLISVLLSWTEKTISLQDILKVLPVPSQDISLVGRLFDRCLFYGMVAKSPYIKATHRRIIVEVINERMSEYFYNGFGKRKFNGATPSPAVESSTVSPAKSRANVTVGKRNANKTRVEATNKRKKTIYDSGDYRHVDIF